MSTRTRVISQSKAVYVTPTGWLITEDSDNEAEDLDTISGHQLHRVDNFSFEIDLAGSRQDVREFGQLSRVSTVRLSEIDPTVTLGYYLGNGENELALGFDQADGTYVQMAKGMLEELEGQSQRNIFVATVAEGQDAFAASYTGMAYSGQIDVVGFGNCFVNNYSTNFSVGEIPRVDVEFQASNVVVWSNTDPNNSGLFNPSLDLDGARTHSGLVVLPPPSTGELGHYVLRPHDISVTFVKDQISDTSLADDDRGAAHIGGVNLSSMPIQSLSIDMPLSREVLDKLGAERAYAKPLQFPIDVTMNMSSLVNEFTTGALEYAINGTSANNTVNIIVDIKNGSAIRNQFILSGAVLDSQSFSQGLDDNETVDLTFSAQIGGASTTSQGLFFSGAESLSVSLTGDAGAYIVSGAAAPGQPIAVSGWVDAENFDGSDSNPDGHPDDDDRGDVGEGAPD